ncbi:MAG: hypothetical protein V4663_03340 [Bacteroidota bacterium]
MKHLFSSSLHTTDHALYTLLKALKVKVIFTTRNDVSNEPD